MRYIVYVIYDFDEPVHVKIMKYQFYLFKDWSELFDQEDIEFKSYILEASDVEQLLSELKAKYDISIHDFTNCFFIDTFLDYINTGCSGKIKKRRLVMDADSVD